MSLDFDERDRRSIVGDLRSADPDVRRLAVERLSLLPRREAVIRLVDQLGDPDWRVRGAAVERLIDRVDIASTVVELIAVLGDPDHPERCGGAVEALIRCGAAAVPILVEACACEDAKVRKSAVDALTGIGDPRAAGAVLVRLDDCDPNVRAAVADALGAIGGDEAERALCALATREDEDPLVRLAALRALDALEVGLPCEQLASMLADPLLGPLALFLLAFDGRQEVLDILLERLLRPDSAGAREPVMRAILRFLSRVDLGSLELAVDRIRAKVKAEPGLFEEVFLRLEQADLATRLVLVQFLALLELDESVIPILRAACHDPLRDLALGALAAMDGRAERAIDGAWQDLGPELRRQACLLFARSGGPRAAARLVECLDDAASATRMAAARAVASRGVGEAVPELVRGLERAAARGSAEGQEELETFTEALVALADAEADAGPDAGAAGRIAARLGEAPDLRGPVRLALAGALGRTARSGQVGLLGRLLEDPLPAVRRVAVDGLARIGPRTVPGALRIALADECPQVRIAAAAALAAIESDGFQDELEILADDADARVRAAALGALARRFGRHEDEARRERALGRLRRGLADEVPVVRVALESLREIGAARGAWVLPLLACEETSVLREAMRCLGAIGDGPHVDSIVSLVSHPDASVRAEAIRVLAQRRRVVAAPAILRRLDAEQDGFVRQVMLSAMRQLEA